MLPFLRGQYIFATFSPVLMVDIQLYKADHLSSVPSVPAYRRVVGTG